jgi:hypothetical protein
LCTIEKEFQGDPHSKRTGTLDVVFQRPWQESITSVEPDALVRRVLDGFDAWQLVQARSPDDPVKFDPSRPESLSILGLDDVRSLRADTWENLYYYRDIDRIDGTMQDIGPTTIDGVQCEQVRMTHANHTTYDRFFEAATGRLVYTATSIGAQIHESGSQIVDGVRFPQKITIETTAKGVVQTTRMEFTKVTVNEMMPESYFAAPPPPVPLDQPQPAPKP